MHFGAIIFNLLHRVIQADASGLAQEKSRSLIITYAGTLIKSTC